MSFKTEANKRYGTVLVKLGHMSHLAYFALAAAKGPYYWAAGVCFVIGVVSWLIGAEHHEPEQSQ